MKPGFFNDKDMKLLQYINYQVVVTDEALLVKAIRDLYNADTTKTKETFMQQASIIFFMADPRSSYSDIIDSKEKFEEILKCEGIKVKMTKTLQAAIDRYAELSQTTSSKLLEDTKIAVSKVRKFLREVDLDQLDDKNRPIYTVSSITTAIKQIPQLSKDLVETERVVNKEIEEQGRMRGGDKNKSMDEDNSM